MWGKPERRNTNKFTKRAPDAYPAPTKRQLHLLFPRRGSCGEGSCVEVPVYVMDDHKKWLTRIATFFKEFLWHGWNRRGMRAVIDCFEIYTTNSLTKKKILETNFIMSRTLFRVAQRKQKKIKIIVHPTSLKYPHFLRAFFSVFSKNFFITTLNSNSSFNIFFIIWLKIIISHAPLHAYEYGLFNWNRKKIPYATR